MKGRAITAATALCLCAPSASFAQDVSSKDLPAPVLAAATTATSLPAGTPVVVTLDDTLSSMTSKVGDHFEVSFEEDVVDKGTIVVPKGTIGHGEVTFVTNKGAFGKPGILSIVLDNFDLNGKTISLDGRYREQGQDKDGVAGATMFAVGIFAGFIKGKAAFIPKGRELKAHTGEDIAYALAPPAPKLPGDAGSAASVEPNASGPSAAPVHAEPTAESKPSVTVASPQATSS